MRRVTLGVIVVVAGVAVGALGASVASAALPEFKNGAGVVPTGVKFTTTDINPVLKTPGAGITISCREEAGSGKITGAKTVGEMHMQYTGCEAGLCGTVQSGATAGVIETNILNGTLGYISSVEKWVGEKLKPASGTEFSKLKFQFESLSCPNTGLTGAVIGEVQPGNILSAAGELNFYESAGKQAIQMLEGETSSQHLTAFGFESVLASTETVMFAEPVEVKGGGGGGAEPTSLSTKLSGEGKEAEELTILEGVKAKDKATLSGKNASKATGTVTYKVYSDKECKTLLVSAGEVMVSGESVPASSEQELAGGKSYYWQAHYGGDPTNKESTSPCSEILNVKAKTSLSLKLSGEGREAEELTISTGSKATGKATLAGTNSATAGGKAAYAVYSDNKCETLVTAAGEVEVNAGNIPASSEEELEGNKTYYWQATYKGDGLHQESKSTCGKAVLKINPVCAKPYCEPTITPGVEVKISVVGATNLCTAGPIMKNGAELLLLTAGHCFENEGNIKEEVKSKYPNGAKPEKKIGATGTATDTNEYDVGEVKIENGEWLLAGGSAPPVLVEWELAPKVATVTGKAANKRNEATCFSGAISVVHCGEILRTGATSPNGVKNLVETTIDGEGGDSGAPEYAPGKGVLIQGIFVKGGSKTASAKGKLTLNSNEVTGFPPGEPGDMTCEEITKLKEWWTTVPIEGEGIPANTTVTGCKEIAGPPPTATLEMSAKATKTAEVEVTYGRKVLGWFEPMSQIEAKYPGQTLVVK